MKLKYRDCAAALILSIGAHYALNASSTVGQMSTGERKPAAGQATPAPSGTPAKKSAPSETSMPPSKRVRVKPLNPKDDGVGSTPGLRVTKRDAPRAGAALRNQLGMDFAYVPAGSFMMGSINGNSDEKPAHQVTIREGFYMGRHEVTQRQWQAVMGNNPSGHKGESRPVETVSWNDAQEYISKLNAQDDEYSYRLPTEAEWEYACRAGTTGDYSGVLDSMAWHSNNSGGRTHPVGQKQPNGFGLYDMHGNVREWCEDSYHSTYAGAPTDGSAWVSSGDRQQYKVSRGGSWDDSASGLRCASRRREAPDQRLRGVIGFRLVAIKRRSP